MSNTRKPSSNTTQIVAQAWADAMLSYTLPDSPQAKARRAVQEAHDAEMRWLRESLERDILPDWLISMVIENW